MHDHPHSSPNYNRAFAIGVLLNTGFVGVEAVYGWLADSMALIADAGHNLSDVLGLLLAWGASVLSQKAATNHKTYGYRKVTVMAALVSAVLLLLAIGAIAWESVGRFFNPSPVEGSVVIVVALIGVVINTLTAWLFYSGQKHDLNIRGAFLHMAADALISLGVAVAGVIILLKGWLWIDPLASFAIVVVILVGTWGLLRESSNLAIDGVPEGTDIGAIRHYLNDIPEVVNLHDLHVWALSTSEVALTVHLVVDDDSLGSQFLQTVQHRLHDEFEVEHATIQIEQQGANACLLDRHACT